MKLNFFFIRSMSIIMMLILTAVSLILGLVMFYVSMTITGQKFFFPWLLFGDVLIPLALFIPAIIFRNRYCATAAVIVSFINIFMRMMSILVFYETFMPLDYNSLRLLLEHTDMESVKTILGSNFLLWVIPAILLYLGMVTYCSMLVWKTADKTSRKVSSRSLKIFSILLGLSLLSNTAFQIVGFHTSTDNYLSIRPLPLIVADITQQSLSALYHGHIYTPVPLPDSSRQLLAEMKIIDPPGTEHIPAAAVFDKIIIIAVESLDYDFIGISNADMPLGITPNLDHYSTGFFSMTNYYTSSQPTSWGLTSILLSRVDYDRDRYMNPVSLFTLAKDQGYYTYYFSAASGHFGDNRRTYGSLFKADKQMFREEWQRKYPIRSTSQWGLSDNDLYKCILQEFEADRKQKFIAVISPVDTHPPYADHGALPDALRMRFPTPFLQALHSTDRELGRFIRALMADPDFYDERTLIIITADHTATFGENYLQRSDFTPGRVPLILICKNQEILADINPEKFASSIDLPPTIARWIGSVPATTFMGRDLASDKNHAITRLFNDTLIFYGPDGIWSVPTAEYNESDPRQKAVCDFFYSFYGKPQ